MQETPNFCRNCPICKTILRYATSKAVKRANRRKCICKSCATSGERNPNYGKPCPEHLRKILSKVHSGKIESAATRQKKSVGLSGECNGMFGMTGSLHPTYGITRTEEQKQYLRELRTGVPISQERRDAIGARTKGRITSPETKRKQRLGIIRYLEKRNGQMSPRYSKVACDFFANLEKERRWNGLYATKNGEFFVQYLGYFVDYYEPTQNIVVEYDEPRHYYADNSLKKRDKNRMQEIVEYLKCRFYRYNERTRELKEYTNLGVSA